jgi:SpoVK/Ycf46/Vps4 family AAA+-type ATPase
MDRKALREVAARARQAPLTALLTAADGASAAKAAEALASELGRELYRVDLSQVVSKYIGETEKNLRQLFDAAESRGAVLFFDEADALFGKRTDVKDAHDRYANLEVSHLIERLEAYNGLAILATNRKGSLDEAFTRRIKYVELPGA